MNFKDFLVESTNTLQDQIKIDRNEAYPYDDQARADILEKVVKKFGNLKIIGDIQDNDKDRRKLGFSENDALDDETFKSHGYKKTLFESADDDYFSHLWWNSKTNIGLLEIGSGDFGQWVVQK